MSDSYNYRHQVFSLLFAPVYRLRRFVRQFFTLIFFRVYFYCVKRKKIGERELQRGARSEEELRCNSGRQVLVTQLISHNIPRSGAPFIAISVNIHPQKP